MNIDINKIIQLRKEIHQNPDLSKDEYNTVNRIRKFFEDNTIDAKLYNVENSLLAIIEGKEDGETIAFRGDIDAIAVEETNNIEYKSRKSGVSHACGHDGHLASNAAIALMLKNKKLKKGRVMIIFQSAEETGEGAKEIVNSEIFQAFKPLYVFGYHNLPGFSLNQVVVIKETFAMASVGVKIELEGQNFHAAYIEDEHCPAQPLHEIINQILNLPKSEGVFNDFVSTSLNYVKYGEPSFGVSPNKAIMQFTFRSETTKSLERLNNISNKIVEETVKKHGKVSFKYTNHEYFPATMNTPNAINLIANACDIRLLDWKYHNQSFRWSEDFAYYNSCVENTAIFGIGAGLNHTRLHTSNYDFPDEIIETYLMVVENILIQLGIR